MGDIPYSHHKSAGCNLIDTVLLNFMMQFLSQILITIKSNGGELLGRKNILLNYLKPFK
jgi:hypothetical protein